MEEVLTFLRELMEFQEEVVFQKKNLRFQVEEEFLSLKVDGELLEVVACLLKNLV